MNVSYAMRFAITMLWVLSFLTVSASGEHADGRCVEKWDYLLYLPDSLASDAKYPLVVAFSPGGDAEGLVRSWKEHVRSRKCALYCSKVVRNGMDVPPVLKRIARQVPELAKEYPVDSGRVITTGVSGGGMTAHLFAFLHPEAVSAVITSVGYIHENSLKHTQTYPKNKVCAFLTSPTDFNYQLMQEDKKFLDAHQWKTRWWEFEGGHRQAPGIIIDEALDWVLEQLSPASSTTTLQ